MQRPLTAAAALACAALLAGCQQPRRGTIEDDEAKECPRERSGGTTLVYRAGEIPALAADPAAGGSAQVTALVRSLDAVRATVAETLGREVLPLEARIHVDPAQFGQQLYLVTHARILSPPIRVVVPCPLRSGETLVEFEARIRTTIAHEVAEATVIQRFSRSRIPDPFLRWLHDGIAVFAEFAVDADTSPVLATQRLEGYLKDLFRVRNENRRIWLDLTRWRQLTSWIVNTEELLASRRRVPLDTLGAALDVIAEQRSAETSDWLIQQLDALERLVADAWRKSQRDLGSKEANPKSAGDAIAFYDVAFAFWLDLERKHPGTVKRVLDAFEVRGSGKLEILTIDAVIAIVAQASGEDVRPRLQRFTFEEAETIFKREIARLEKTGD